MTSVVDIATRRRAPRRPVDPPEPPRRRPALVPFTVEHFRVYMARLVYDDGQRREPEPFQLDFAREVFAAIRMVAEGRVKAGQRRISEAWLILPEGNGKTTFIAAFCLYCCDWAKSPWIPVGASSRDQAKTLYTQAKGFVTDTPGLARRFVCFDGYRSIVPLNPKTGKKRPGRGIEITPWDPASNDGVIPFPIYVCDELHRHPDMSLWRLWKGKARKRKAVGVGISTAGTPGSEFEMLRDAMRQMATSAIKRHGGTIYRGRTSVMVEYRLERREDAENLAAVAKINPLAMVDEESLGEDFHSPSFDLGDWLRLKCNIAARSSRAAITDEEWAMASHPDYPEIPEGVHIDGGLDVGWKWDTTSFTPLWRTPETVQVGAKLEPVYLWGEAEVIVPPRNGSTTSPDTIKLMLQRAHARNPIDTLVMDMTDAADIASWAADELGCTVIDRPTGNKLAVADYKNVTRGLRSGLLRRVPECPKLTTHSMNAVRWRLPGGDSKFERPDPSRSKKKQDERVIDALDAGAFAYTNVCVEPEPERTIDLAAYRIRTI